MKTCIGVLALALLFVLGAQARAAEPARWSALSHTSFKHQLGAVAGGGGTFAQDHSGFIWMGTQSGLVRWDGYRMRNYGADGKSPGALPDGIIISLHVDAAGSVWAGTSAGGLVRYDAATDRFITYKPGEKGVSHARVSAMANDGRGGLWIGTAAGLDHMAADGTIRNATSANRPLPAGSLPEGGIEELLLDHSGALWIGTRHGLLRLAADGSGLEAISIGAGGEAAPSINALCEDSSGRMWVGTRANGAFIVAAGATVGEAVRESGEHPSLHKERVLSIAEVDADEMWLGTEGGGIVAVNARDGSTRRIRHQPDIPDSLHDDDVYALFRERSGLIFVASTESMSIHDPRPRAVQTIRNTGLGNAIKLSVPSILMRADGKLWMGILGGGIDIVDSFKGGVASLPPGDGINSLPKGRVIALADGPDNMVYIGTQQGLYVADGDGRRVRRVNVPHRASSASVWALAVDGGILWIGGIDGVWAVNPSDPTHPTLLRHESDSLGDSRVTAMLAVSGGGLWVGTRASLIWMELDKAGLDRLPADPNDPTRLPPGYISSLRIDQRGRLWVSTFGVGVEVLERTDNAGRRWFHRIGTAQGLPNAGINAVLPDKNGAMWASTDDGLARIDPVSWAVRTLRPADGLNVNVYWSNSAAIGPDGELLFGGLSGLTIFRPERLSETRYAAPLVVGDITLGDKALAVGPYNRSGNGAAPATPIEVTPQGRERGFALEFALLDYSSAESNEYAYRLVGFDQDWITTSASARRVSYNNLPPGEYTLQLRGANRSGEWTPPLNIPVRVLPAWHQRTAVRALGVLGVLGLLFALVQARTAYLRRRQVELQTMVDERTAELRKTQSQLEQMAYSDPLTGLPNRRVFNDELRRMGAHAQREMQPFTLLLIDLDHFKEVNDSLGHDAGDVLLVITAERLNRVVRETDRLARLGGDEFAVLLGDTSDRELVAGICQRIIGSLSEPLSYRGKTMQVGASIGVATFEPGKGELEALYKAADIALYEAKSSGRNRFRWHGAHDEVYGGKELQDVK